MSDTQDVLDRRIYIVRPKNALLERLKSYFDEKDIAQIARPYVVMTEELYFEKCLEGWRNRILECCKEAYLKDEFDYGILFELENKDEVLGQTTNLVECFNKWWLAEEASGYTEIETSWLSKNA